VPAAWRQDEAYAGVLNIVRRKNGDDRGIVNVKDLLSANLLLLIFAIFRAGSAVFPKRDRDCSFWYQDGRRLIAAPALTPAIATPDTSPIVGLDFLLITRWCFFVRIQAFILGGGLDRADKH
jgi:hypothetical protein